MNCSTEKIESRRREEGAKGAKAEKIVVSSSRTSRLLRAFVIAFVLTSGFSFAQAPATQPTTQPAKPASPELLKQVQERLKNVKTVQSEFTQEKDLAVLKHKLLIKGTFALEQPDRVIWNVREPVRYVIRVEGDEVRQWDQDTNKVKTIHVGADPTFKAITEQIQAWFLGDYAALSQTYDVDVVGENPLALGFTPKPGTMVSKVLQHVDVGFGDGDAYINKMVVREASGSVTTLDFLDPKLNEAIPPTTWEIPPHDR